MTSQMHFNVIVHVGHVTWCSLKINDLWQDVITVADWIASSEWSSFSQVC